MKKCLGKNVECDVISFIDVIEAAGGTFSHRKSKFIVAVFPDRTAHYSFCETRSMQYDFAPIGSDDGTATFYARCKQSTSYGYIEVLKKAYEDGAMFYVFDDFEEYLEHRKDL